MKHGAVTKVVRDGLLDISTGRRLGKKRTISENMSGVKTPRTRLQRILAWLNTPVKG